MDATERDVLFLSALESKLRQNPTAKRDLQRAALTDAPWDDPQSLLWTGLAMPAGTPPDEEQVHILTAALYAWHPVEGQASFPAALRLYVKLHPQEADMIENRFLALLDRPWEQLPHDLSHFVRKLVRVSIPLNWPQLLADLREWDERDTSEGSTRRRWAQEFWGREAKA